MFCFWLSFFIVLSLLPQVLFQESKLWVWLWSGVRGGTRRWRHPAHLRGEDHRKSGEDRLRPGRRLEERNSGCGGWRDGAAVSRCWVWYSERGRAGEPEVRKRGRRLWKVHYLLRGFNLRSTEVLEITALGTESPRTHSLTHSLRDASWRQRPLTFAIFLTLKTVM